MNSSVHIAVAVALSMLVPGCGKGSGGAADKVKAVTDAQKLVELGQCEAATVKLREFTSSTPDSFDGFLALGDALVCVCFGPPDKAPGGRKDPGKCNEALASYESALKLRKDSVSALVSAGTLSLMLGDEEAAALHLESAAKEDPSNAAAANLLAFATRKTKGEDEAVALLERHYAKRKPSDVAPPTIESLCGTGFQCGTVVLLETVTSDGATKSDSVKKVDGPGKYKMTAPDRSYEVGTVIEDAVLADNEIMFTDRLHPVSITRTGWVVKSAAKVGAVPGWQNPNVTAGPVVERRIPELPYFDPFRVSESERAIWREWDSLDRVTLERKLGLVEDVVPGSIVPGQDEKIGPMARQGAFAGGATDYKFILVPVTYKKNIFNESRLPVASVAVTRVTDAAAIARLKFLSLAEKRAALAGQLWKGAPLFVGVRVRSYKLRDAALSLRDGRVALRFAHEGQTEVYEGGECETPRNPSIVEEDVIDGE